VSGAHLCLSGAISLAQVGTKPRVADSGISTD
jgi:hypothetical protein